MLIDQIMPWCRLLIRPVVHGKKTEGQNHIKICWSCPVYKKNPVSLVKPVGFPGPLSFGDEVETRLGSFCARTFLRVPFFSSVTRIWLELGGSDREGRTT
ncbi:hypothetical protein MCOR29_002414 [Pyricularia oryzae]|nr:hypothetical protein MCOR01_009665 [Pyricularia oryzae]KAI6325119.1 hypothetical protein MCOR34_001254 [Pyricularia oryzae]KAI6329007.1 hypothetical protein MCOR29_002414 [Pyricularia oryzae]KAI6366364.1 hypothetical protein MCOR31_006558 [Pyricularia oryzae]KAI6384834.1 hypothetical protein MCOR32_001904 [Pyricularia oryzae]